jgi:hypothetical protein
MKIRILIALLVTAALPWTGAAKDKKHAGPAPLLGWLHVQSSTRKLLVSEKDLQKVSRTLPQGALLPVLRTEEKHGLQLAQVGALNFQTGSMELGWVEITPKELIPPESYPMNSELLQLLGGLYLDDLTAAHTDIARFLVRQAQGPPALLCYLVAAPLSLGQLVIFTPSNQGKYLSGGALNFPLTDMPAGITSLEIRDLLGDGSDCAITREAFREQAQTYGSNLRIRKIANGQFQTLWQAPVEFHNLSQYGPKMQILQPPEQNIGAPGTVTAAEVTFRPAGKGEEPVWKGKVDFFVFGRDKPYDFVKIEKACPWDGQAFAPLR